MALKRNILPVLLLSALCTKALSQDIPPYQFNGIVLGSSAADLPSEYKAIFTPSDCYVSKQGQAPIRHCSKDFSPNTLPGLPSDVKGPVRFYLHYLNERLQQIGFVLTREDYAPFVAMITREYGPARRASTVIMDDVKETEYTWNRDLFVIGAYAFHRNTKNAAVNYGVRTEQPLPREQLKMKPKP